MRTKSFLLFCLLSLLLPLASAFAADAGRVVQAASEVDYPPYSIVNGQGQADGFAVALLSAALREVGQSVAFTTGTWQEVRRSLEDGRVEVLPLVGRTPEREALYDFTFPYLTMHGAIVVRQDEGRITTLNDLRGREVAVMRGDNAEEFLRRSAVDASVVTTPTFGDALTELAAGRHDAVVIQKLLYLQLAAQHRLDTLKVAAPLTSFSQSFCFAVRKGNRQLLQLLNEGLAIVFANGTYEQLYRKWITPIERPYSDGKSRIVVGGGIDYPPYEYLDANGQPAGYSVELTRAIAKKAGVAVDIQLRPWHEIRDGLKNGSIDLVQGMFYSADRDLSFDFSPAHTYISLVAVVRDGTSLPASLADLDGKIVGVEAGDILQDLLAERGKAGQVVTANSAEQLLQLLYDGRCDYALTARIPALYLIKENGWDHLKVSDVPLVSLEYCYATAHGNEALLKRFADGLAALQQSGEYRQIYARTIGAYESDQVTDLKYFIAAIIGLFAFLAVLLTLHRGLRQRIRERTADLEREVQERRKLLDKVMEREHTINLILNSTAEGIYGVDSGGACIFFNKAAQSLLGYDERELLGRNVHPLIAHTAADGSPSDETDCRVREVLATGIPCNNDDAILWGKDGDWISVAYDIHPINSGGQTEGAVVTFTDITDRKKLIEQRIRAGQLSSLGELAAGVAHEINNPITGVINYAQILLNKHVASGEGQNLAQNIVKEGNRIAVIVRNLLNFAHKDRESMRPVAIKEIVNEAVELMRQQLVKDGIFLDLEFAEPLPQIYGNAQKLEQVILNLISNARHALNKKFPAADPNKILRISAEQIDADDSARLQVVVWDEGHGIAEKNLKRVFNRFFTTKPAGVGTGLGLSIVHDILEEHGASIVLESEVDLYTKVVMEFAVYRDAAQAE